MRKRRQKGVSDGYKRCSKCDEVKDSSYFTKTSCMCRSCSKEYATARYIITHPNNTIVDGPARQDAILKMLDRLDREYEKRDNKRFSKYVEKNYGFIICSKCNKLRIHSDFGVIKTQSPRQCIECFRKRKNSESKKTFNTTDGRKKSYMHTWFQRHGIPYSCVPAEARAVVLKMIELNMAIKHAGGI